MSDPIEPSRFEHWPWRVHLAWGVVFGALWVTNHIMIHDTANPLAMIGGFLFVVAVLGGLPIYAWRYIEPPEARIKRDTKAMFARITRNARRNIRAAKD